MAYYLSEYSVQEICCNEGKYHLDVQVSLCKCQLLFTCKLSVISCILATWLLERSELLFIQFLSHLAVDIRLTLRLFCVQTNRNVSCAQVLTDYVAAKDGELTVSKGEIVQLVSCTGPVCLVCRQTNDQSTVVEGLLPSHVLMTKDLTDNGIR